MNKQEIEKAIKTLEKLKSKGCVKFEVDGYPCSSFIEIEPILTALEHQLTDMWIPVSERLPDKTGWYLTTIKRKDSGEVIVGMNDFDRVGFIVLFGHFEVIAWRPLPEPWKEDTHE